MLVQIPSTSDAVDDRGRLYKVSDVLTLHVQHGWQTAGLGSVAPLILACSSRQVFNVFIGGHYHCSLRYSHLLNFSQEVYFLLPPPSCPPSLLPRLMHTFLPLQLGRHFDVSGLDEFPAKRVFSLGAGQLEERRAGLEKYLHSGGPSHSLMGCPKYSIIITL